jgi:hypothetical protein
MSDHPVDLTSRETYLKPPNQKPIRSHLGKRLRPELQQRRNPPANIHPRHEPVHRHIRENEQERDLTDGRTDSVHRLQLRQLVPVEAEVFFHAGDVRIVCADG